MTRLLLVTLGGALGSGARYLFSNLAQSAFGTAFPFGTLGVNVIGSFLICAIMHLGGEANLISPSWRLFLTTGIMGGFTTYSAFDLETYRYTQQGNFGFAGLYVATTLLLCFLAGMAGDATAKALL